MQWVINEGQIERPTYQPQLVISGVTPFPSPDMQVNFMSQSKNKKPHFYLSLAIL